MGVLRGGGAQPPIHLAVRSSDFALHYSKVRTREVTYLRTLVACHDCCNRKRFPQLVTTVNMLTLSCFVALSLVLRVRHPQVY